MHSICIGVKWHEEELFNNGLTSGLNPRYLHNNKRNDGSIIYNFSILCLVLTGCSFEGEQDAGDVKSKEQVPSAPDVGRTQQLPGSLQELRKELVSLLKSLKRGTSSRRTRSQCRWFIQNTLNEPITKGTIF